MYDDGATAFDPSPPPAAFQSHMRRTVEVAIDEALAPRPEADILDVMAASATHAAARLRTDGLAWQEAAVQAVLETVGPYLETCEPSPAGRLGRGMLEAEVQSWNSTPA